MKSITKLQIIFDIILIAGNGYLGFAGESIYLFIALFWCISLCLHISLFNMFK